MSDLKLSICFVTEGLAFTGAPIETQSLGGSESALWFLARALAKRGHYVDVFCRCPQPGMYEGVTYMDISWYHRMATAKEWDWLICSRFFQYLGRPLRTRLNWLWTHDMPTNIGQQVAAVCYQLDQLVALSQFHKDAWIKEWEHFEPIIWQSRNGVDTHLLRKYGTGKRNPKRLIYASRPERGLELLLTRIWPELHKQDPNLELVICGYATQGYHNFPPGMQQFYEHCEHLIQQSPGVTNLGELKKSDFYYALSTAAAMAYPCVFPEISCIAAIEAMSLGVPVITTNDFALKETVPYRGVEGFPNVDVYVGNFVSRTMEVLNAPLVARRLMHEGRQWVESRYTWDKVAEEWEARAMAQFQERSNVHGRRICQGLLFNSDVIAAKHMAEIRGYPDIIEQVDTYLANHHQRPDEYFDGSVPTEEWKHLNSRFKAVIEALPPVQEGKTLTVLDLGCGSGALLGHLAQARPDVLGHGVDFSPKLIKKAHELTSAAGFSNRLTFEQATTETWQPSRQYDVVIAAEVLEHQEDYLFFIALCESCVRPGGTVIFTVPSGAWESYSFHDPSTATNAHHLHHFEHRDLEELFGKKEGYRLEYGAVQQGLRGDLLGNWVVCYQRTTIPTGNIDYARKFLTSRPRQTIAACMIVKNEEDNLRRAIKSFIDVVDEIWIWDCGSTDRTMEIAKEFGGRFWPKLYLRTLDTNPDGDGLGNFGFWRNQSIEETTADWCFVPGTPIRTRTGFKSIEEVQIGEEVLTHTGRFRKVEQLFVRQYIGNIRWVQPYYAPQPIGMTPNHSVLATKNFGCYIAGKFCFPECRRQWRSEDWRTGKAFSTVSPNCQQGYREYELDWIPAEQLEKADTVVYQAPLPEGPIAPLTIDLTKWVNGEWLEIGEDWLRPKNNRGKAVPRYIACDEEFWRLCGYYLAEGFVGNDNWTINFAFHEKETDYHAEVFAAMAKYFRLEGVTKTPPRSKGVNLTFASRVVAEFLSAFLGNGADNKRIPDCARNIPAQHAFQIFVGFWRGDGTQADDSFQTVSNSRTLTYQMRDILLQLQVVSSVLRHDQARTRAWKLSIGGSGLDRLAQFGMTHPFIAARAGHLKGGSLQGGWTDGHRMYMAIREISEEEYQGPVYNLGVEEDNSYVAGDMVVHNCYWQDADEILINPRNVRKYANESTVFNAYVVKQNHAQLNPHPSDALPADEPQRLFRNHRGYHFVGCVHEQPCNGRDINGEIQPALILPDVDIMHYGYMTQEQTRIKCVQRNMPLVRKDRLMYPQRSIGPLLVLRDYLNLSQFRIEESGGQITEQILTYLRSAVQLFLEHYGDPSNKYHSYALKYHQVALQFLGQRGIPVREEWGIPFEVKFAMVIGVGGTDQRANPSPITRWFACVSEFIRFLRFENRKVFAPLCPTPTFDALWEFPSLETEHRAVAMPASPPNLEIDPALSQEALARLACPSCFGELRNHGSGFVCNTCHREFSLEGDTANFMPTVGGEHASA